MAGSGLDHSADAAQLRTWLESEYGLPAATAATLAELYLPEAQPVAAASASKAYVAGEWAETDQSMWCGARRAAHTHASATARAFTPLTPIEGNFDATHEPARVGAPAASAFLYRFARGVGGAPMVHHSDDIPFWFDAREALDAAGALPVRR